MHSGIGLKNLMCKKKEIIVLFYMIIEKPSFDSITYEKNFFFLLYNHGEQIKRTPT